MDLHKDHFNPKTVSSIDKCIKSSLSRNIPVIMLYEDDWNMMYIILAEFNLALYLIFLALDYLSVSHINVYL